MAERKGRRRFIFKGAVALAGFPFLGRYLSACSPARKAAIPGKLSGPSFKAGHLLRTGLAVVPAQSEQAEVVIVGGGVAGLSANRWLHRHRAGKVVLLEMEDQPGGNAAAGKNQHTAFPWGAHYLTLPNNDLQELLDFLQEQGVISGYDENGLPVYNEYYLCFDPEERLYIRGYWQAGLVPHWGVPETELQQIQQFFARIEILRQARGADGKFAFSIPLDTSSADEQYRRLDALSMHDWLEAQGFTSPHLRWYLNYCCLDDYGCGLEQASAWAGLHYFASRKAQAANTDPDRVLTWPEGNHWLTSRLQQSSPGTIRSGCLTYRITPLQDQVAVDYLDLATNRHRRVLARYCLLATPQFVSARLLPGNGFDLGKPGFSYSTWLVANLTLKKVPEGRGTPLCWDNVIYGSNSLGYVYANHQQVQLYPEKQTITFYLPLTGRDPDEVRGQAYRKDQQAWQELVLSELEKAHPHLRDQVESLDMWLWGHGMIRPTTGFIWGETRAAAARPVAGKIFFAHSDLSGISVFEEAFYQGLQAAQQIIDLMHEPTT